MTRRTGTRRLGLMLSAALAICMSWCVPAFAQSSVGTTQSGSENEVARPSGNDIDGRTKIDDPILAGTGSGGCCFEDGSCQVLTIAECDVQGGRFQGLDVPCDATSCPGACCYGDGTCTLGTAQECADAGGLYQGEGTDCDCIDCGLAACCLPTGTCINLNLALCEIQGGVSMGAGTTCGAGNFCEAQVQDFELQISPNMTSLIFDQFDDMGGARILEKVILFMRSDVGAFAQVENASELPIPNGVLNIIEDETLDFRDMQLAFGFNETFPAPPLAPVDKTPNGGPDFHNYGSIVICAEDFEERVNGVDNLMPFIGLGTLNADWAANGVVGFLAPTDFELDFQNFFSGATVKVAYIYRIQTGACCLCDGTCIDDVTIDECDDIALNQTGRAPQSFTAAAECADVTCEPIGACCLCTGECLDNVTQAECEANVNFVSFTACTECADIVCEPRGACCLCTGECLENVTEAQCLANPDFQAFTPCATCADVNCEPIGACCLCTGVCLDGVTEAACLANPNYQSFHPCLECADIDCEPIGACCLCTGECLDDVTEAECLANPNFQSFTACAECADIVCEPLGACCLCTGVCLDNVTETACLANPNYQSFHPCMECADIDCEPIGACCLCTGECLDGVTEAACLANPNFQSFHPCMECADINCEPIGACCLCTGECLDGVTEAACLANPNYQSFHPCLECADIDCEPVGACCLCTGECLDNVTEAECLANPNFKSYHPCMDCADVDCEPMGACCLCDGTCIDNVTQDVCESNPNFQAFYPCEECADIVCEPVGACCNCDGVQCDITTPAECAARGAEWRYLGDCSSCDECEALGACCFPGQTPDCMENLTEDECLAQGGENFTPCASCDDIVCVKGACCLPDETCVDDVYEQECYDDFGGVSFHPDATCAEVQQLCQFDCRMTCTDKGSLIIFSKIEVRWDSSGSLVQDTFVTLSNDHPDDVMIQFYFINGDEPIIGHPGWNYVDNKIMLTGNQTVAWSAATGSGVVSPWTVLDPDMGRPANDGTGDNYLRGYIIGWAVNDLDEEIRWNHLSGDGTLVYYGGDKAAWQYNACTAAVAESSGVAHGQPTGTPGVLNLDGSEYCTPPSHLLMNFQAVSSAAYSTSFASVTSDTDVTLHPLDVVLDPDSGASPVITKAHYDVWNENEVKLSGAYRCISCWDQTLLSQYGIPNHFLLPQLQSDHGKARIDGLGSPLCPGSESVAMLGLVARWLEFTGNDGLAASGVNMIHMGFEPAVIQYAEMTSEPPESPADAGKPAALNPFEDADAFIDQLRKEAVRRMTTADNR